MMFAIAWQTRLCCRNSGVICDELGFSMYLNALRDLSNSTEGMECRWSEGPVQRSTGKVQDRSGCEASYLVASSLTGTAGRR